MAIIIVEGSMDDYEIDTEEITCTCRDFTYRRSSHSKDHPERLCKHMEEVKDKLNLSPKVEDSRKPYQEVKLHAYKIETLLKMHKGVEFFEITGSYRRLSPTLKDLDCIISGEDIESFFDFIESDPKNIKLWRGPVKASYIFQGEIQVDFMVINPENKAFALLHFTGSKSHNIEMRRNAKNLGYTLNEYGLYDIEKEEYVDKEIFKTEKDIFEFLNLPYVYPQDR